jgi:ABC-2 type transport system ATP-binding protein
MHLPWTRSEEPARIATPQPDAAIEVHGLRKEFGDFVAVDDIDFTVKRGEIFGFLGPNGSGKSTTIRMLCGTIGSSGGWARVMGYDIDKQAEDVRLNIGYMSQKFSLFQDLTVDENPRFYAGIYGLSDEKYAERRAYILKMADLEGREDELTENLSVGWKQRLALGCATIHEPRLLFLDEPTSGVDPNARRQFWQLLYELAREGVTLFVTTHYMDEATHCNRLAFIYRGNIIAEGTPQQIKSELAADTILQLEVDDGEGALAALKDDDAVEEAYMQGALLNVNIGRRSAEDTDVGRLLADAGFSVHHIERVEPTLEDAFVHLVGLQGGRA